MNIDRHLDFLYGIRYATPDDNKAEEARFLIKEFIQFFYSVKHTAEAIINLIDDETDNDEESKLRVSRDFAKDILKKCKENK